MTQSLKEYLTRDLWLITSQTKDNLAGNCSGFTITQAFQTSFLFHLKKDLFTGLQRKNGNHKLCPNRIINEEITPLKKAENQQQVIPVMAKAGNQARA